MFIRLGKIARVFLLWKRGSLSLDAVLIIFTQIRYCRNRKLFSWLKVGKRGMGEGGWGGGGGGDY